jgi:hypothetical protein
MSLPILKLRMLPDTRCMKCGCHGYTDDKTSLCGGCLGVSLAVYHRRKTLNLAERMERCVRDFIRITKERAERVKP